MPWSTTDSLPGRIAEISASRLGQFSRCERVHLVEEGLEGDTIAADLVAQRRHFLLRREQRLHGRPEGVEVGPVCLRLST